MMVTDDDNGSNDESNGWRKENLPGMQSLSLIMIFGNNEYRKDDLPGKQYISLIMMTVIMIAMMDMPRDRKT